MKSLLLFLPFIFPVAAFAEDYCTEMHLFEDHYSDELIMGNYEAGHTSGYRMRPDGDYEYRYCVKNLTDQTPFQFRWKGPRPSTLLEGRLAYGRTETEGWVVASAPPDNRAERELGLGNNVSLTYGQVESLFRQSKLEGAETIIPVQDAIFYLDVSSWAAFSDQISATNPERYRRSAGIIFSMPSNPKDWEGFINGDEVPPSSDPVRMQAFIFLDYLPETQGIDLVTSVALQPSPGFQGNFTELLGALSMEFPALAEAGIDARAIEFDGQDRIIEVGRDFFGTVIRQPVANFADFVEDGRPVNRVSVPITLLLEGRPIFEFPFEALGLPSAL